MKPAVIHASQKSSTKIQKPAAQLPHRLAIERCKVRRQRAGGLSDSGDRQWRYRFSKDWGKLYEQEMAHT